MTDWLAEWAAIVCAVSVLMLPGLLLGLVAGLRGLALAAVAPLASTAILTASAIVAGSADFGWTPWAALIGSSAAVVAALAVRLGFRLRSVPPSGGALGRALVLAGVSAGAVLTVCRVGFYIGAPSAISQTNDASFHLSALRYAVETGHASPLEIGGVIGSPGFYPSGWHVLASLVPQLTGSTVEVAANATSLVIAAVAWPLGVAYLARTVAGPLAAATAAALAASIPAFPLLLLQWGVLYPQLLAVAVLPAALAVLADRSALRGESGSQIGRELRWTLLAAIGVVAVGVAQPSVILAWIVGVLTLALWELFACRRVLGAARFAAGGVALFLAAVATMALWVYFARSVAVTWPASTGKWTAALQVMMNGTLGYPWAVGTSVLMLIGLAVAIQSWRLRWLAAAWVIFAGLYFVAAAVANAWIRSALVGPWYEDPYRLAALLPVAVLPLAGAGAARIVSWTAAAVRARSATASWVALSAVVAVGVVSLAVAPQIQRRDVFAQTIDPNLYTPTADSYLSDDELAVLQRLDESVPKDAVVIGNPSTGMAFGYAVSGRDVLPRTWAPPRGSAYAILWADLRHVASDPEVCPALASFGAQYVLDFGPGEEYPGRWIMPGFTDIEGQPGFELVDRQGGATLWRVTACS